ncbi:MAG TPA: hypothetical protein VNG90_04995 [Candidatus Acidoferrum sp.]|nr:hypothetical protein [Candidatus Acidoferrum sp.]
MADTIIQIFGIVLALIGVWVVINTIFNLVGLVLEDQAAFIVGGIMFVVGIVLLCFPTLTAAGACH